MTTVATAGAIIFAPSSAHAGDAELRLKQVITSFDGTPIIVTFMPAEGLQQGEQAPTILMPPGWSSGGDSKPDQKTVQQLGHIGVGPLRAAGYNVATWDPRGFGGVGWRGQRELARL